MCRRLLAGRLLARRVVRLIRLWLWLRRLLRPGKAATSDALRARDRVVTPTGVPVRWSRSRSSRGGPAGCTTWESDTGCVAFAGQDGGLWHVSVSHPRRLPSWDEMRTAREAMTPDHVTMAFILPPRAQYVNIHPNCLHLWQIKE